MTTYKEAGVDIEAGDAAVKRIGKIVKKSFTENTLTDIGGFGGCFNFPKDDYDEPVLVSSADGVGTKLKIAFLSDRHSTVGQCLVNHCVNDILAVGARPLFFLDYFATGKLDVGVLEDVVSGLSQACQENNCSLIGGETAEMPGFYQEGEYDMSGTIVGVVDRKYMLPNKKAAKGDILIGLPSTGLHTNGYSLARKILLSKYDVNEFVGALGCTISDALLAIHKSYLHIADAILEKDWLRGISHITGGGIVNNTKRILKEDQGMDIDWSAWKRPAIYTLIQELGNVPEEDLRQSMNLGIGLILVVRPDGLNECLAHLDTLGEQYYELGKVS
ncbi:MAG: phosphoribosylformylglycinamidine cyclo-ligase [Candidatus Marinimicrobia bacterium]|nr:phosphoribosylformylglycinamidine cyclo-ligase [Candidatus Neomarinimicrobiota bacterium]MBT6870851.1 phosphoribosylformylglycinamidine cyclo-ligase [Candidatus Neomarinimicrobiota bacterium]MBT7377254.1 phosphoribosylformylglycinamidine cyclo-ligase [Candidatus Neomarinimicrobiota bacterium]